MSAPASRGGLWAGVTAASVAEAMAALWAVAAQMVEWRAAGAEAAMEPAERAAWMAEVTRAAGRAHREAAPQALAVAADSALARGVATALATGVMVGVAARVAVRVASRAVPAELTAARAASEVLGETKAALEELREAMVASLAPTVAMADREGPMAAAVTAMGLAGWTVPLASLEGAAVEMEVTAVAEAGTEAAVAALEAVATAVAVVAVTGTKHLEVWAAMG